MFDHGQGDNALWADYMNLPKIGLLMHLDISNILIIAQTVRLLLELCYPHEKKIPRCIFLIVRHLDNRWPPRGGWQGIIRGWSPAEWRQFHNQADVMMGEKSFFWWSGDSGLDPIEWSLRWTPTEIFSAFFWCMEWVDTTSGYGDREYSRPHSRLKSGQDGGDGDKSMVSVIWWLGSWPY